jgi:hypothetical protein
MSFFIHIASKSLEEINQNCEEFLNQIMQNDIRTMEPESSEQDILESQDESGSSMTFKQQQLYKGYKKHHSRHNRILEDSCSFICCTFLGFFAQFLLVACYFISYFLVAYNYHDLLQQAGITVANNSLIELDAINMLVLMKESIANDTNSYSLSTAYYQLNTILNSTIDTMKNLEDIHEYKNIDSTLFSVYESLVMESLCGQASIQLSVCTNQSLGIIQDVTPGFYSH